MNEMPTRAWSVKRLAEAWDCSPRHIYDLIDDGTLKAFSIGPRSLRVTDEEKRRCESLPVKSIDEDDSPLVGAAQLPSQTISMLTASAAGRR